MKRKYIRKKERLIKNPAFLSLNIETELKGKLIEQAKITGKSVSQFVREAIYEKFKKIEDTLTFIETIGDINKDNNQEDINKDNNVVGHAAGVLTWLDTDICD